MPVRKKRLSLVLSNSYFFFCNHQIRSQFWLFLGMNITCENLNKIVLFYIRKDNAASFLSWLRCYATCIWHHFVSALFNITNTAKEEINSPITFFYAFHLFYNTVSYLWVEMGWKMFFRILNMLLGLSIGNLSKFVNLKVKTEPHNMRVSFLLNISYRIYLFVW